MCDFHSPKQKTAIGSRETEPRPSNIIRIEQNLPGTRLDRLITEKMAQILNAMPDASGLGSGCFASIILKHLGRCCFVGLVVDSITTNHAVRPSLRRWPMMLMPNSILMRLSRYQTMWSFEHADELVHRVLGRPFRLHRGDRVRLRRNTTIRIPTIA